MKNKFSSGLSMAQSGNAGFRFDVVTAEVNRDDEVASFNNTCNVANSQTFSAIIDLTWGGWDDMKKEAEKNGMPYLRLEAANHQFVKVSFCLLLSYSWNSKASEVNLK